MHGLQTSYTIRTFNSLRFAYFSGDLYERLLFYELFCEVPSDLRIYAFTTVRGLSATIWRGASVHRYVLYWDIISTWQELLDSLDMIVKINYHTFLFFGLLSSLKNKNGSSKAE